MCCLLEERSDINQSTLSCRLKIWKERFRKVFGTFQIRSDLHLILRDPISLHVFAKYKFLIQGSGPILQTKNAIDHSPLSLSVDN